MLSFQVQTVRKLGWR